MSDEHRPSGLDGDYGAALRKIFDPEKVIERLLAELMVLVPSASAVLVGLAEDDGRVRFIQTAGALHGLAGASITSEASLSGLAMRDQKVLVCSNAAADERVDRVVLEQIEMSSMVSVPLIRNGAAFGVVNIVAGPPDAFDDADLAVCMALAEVLAGVVSLSAVAANLFNALDSSNREVGAESHGTEDSPAVVAQFVTKVLSPTATRLVDTRLRIARVLEHGQLDMVFQPVVELSTMKPVAFEALARFQGPPIAPPNRWFEQAHSVGLGVELELLALRTALDALPALPEGTPLAVNLGPEALCSTDPLHLIREYDPSRLVIELTEHAPVVDYELLSSAISDLRAVGARLAVDDTGAGFSSLAHIAQLQPDIVKLDRWMVEGVDTDPIKQALVEALLTVAGHLHSEVIAEGIETARELRTLRELGVQLGQGYHLGRPGPLLRPVVMATQRLS